MKVLITEVIWDQGITTLQEEGIEVYYDKDLWAKRETLLEIVKDFDAIIVRNQTKVDQKLLIGCTKLKVIGRLGVGLDNIDLVKAKEKGIQVVMARHANATSVAEYVMAAILSAKRPIHEANEDVKNGSWDRRKHTGEELYQKTIGLIGLGEIAHRVAKRARAFGMEVIGYDPFITEYDHIVSETGVRIKSSLEEILVNSDFISIHVPLTPSTKDLISTQQLKSMKPSAFLINTSRGGIIDENALCDSLMHHELAGVFLDVLESEPVDPSNKLLDFKNAIFSPHIAGLTTESQIRISLLVAKEVGKLLKGQKSLCVV
ncbi:hydroxyacid dehydrogenase [Bacillus sp. ISL-41]|uniref:hydroxyacid dehydrogenase n=1 Tax=Bacillus sp. ISL-41 TaxID=2819127 RepID=UPI001BEB7F38|nr:hydroxyacid dehydrogenase [Bacillus sp. ISL-41]MBT2642495.1 hydroxyacid dehydrogenase [Bacillus sp. ISL-41]